MKKQMERALKRAIRKAGGTSQFAKGLNTSHSRVQYWLFRGYMTAEEVLAAERLTGVSRHELRPDIYPQEA